MADPVKGNAATVYVGGTPATITGQATTDVGGTHTVYQITDAAKRVLDPATAVVVLSNGSPIADTSLYVLDYLTGKATFALSRGAETITITAKYVPLLQVAKARALDIEPNPDTADVAVFGDTSPHTMQIRPACSLTIDSIEPVNTDLDTGGGTRILATDLLAGTALFIEAKASSAFGIHGWFVPETAPIKAALADVESLELKMKGVDRNGVVCFGAT
jgi:hypothetical protein